MDSNFSKSIVSAAAAGLMLGALSACAEQGRGAKAPSGGAATGKPAAGHSSTGDADPSAAAGEAKSCCKGMNECRGKGACKTDANECAGRNECKGKGGCNVHCPQ